MQLTQRLLQKVHYEPNTGCWLWTAATHKLGYGQFKYNGVMKQAHRVAYEILVSPFDNDLKVCHKCDTPSCINPSHLFLGTQKDNMIDRSKKGRDYQRKKVLCKRGHKLEESNTHEYYKKRGYRNCIKCSKIYGKKWRAAKNGSKNSK